MTSKLTRARIALFKGMQGEARRMLDEHLKQITDKDKRSPAIIWLEAQVEPYREHRIEKLKTLFLGGNENDLYVQMARHYVDQENEYASRLDPVQGRTQRKPIWQRAVWGVAIWKLLIFLILGAIIAFIVFNSLNWIKLDEGIGSIQISTNDQQVLPGGSESDGAQIELPDKSQSFDGGTLMAAYPRGMIELTAYEDSSERVVDIQRSLLLRPVDGGRFYALKATFECRSGICNAPPEAEVLLVLTDGATITPYPNTGLAHERLMSPIAEGRSTAGWLVYEIPQAGSVDAVLVWPRSEAGSNTRLEPIHINLP